MSAYPLSAVAHQPQLLLALSLVAACPDLGGVLIRGDKGSAKARRHVVWRHCCRVVGRS